MFEKVECVGLGILDKFGSSASREKEESILKLV